MTAEQNISYKLPRKRFYLVFSVFLELASALAFFTLLFFSFGNIAGEELPSLWSFVIDHYMPSYMQFIVPLKHIASIAFYGGIMLLLSSIVKLCCFFSANTNAKIHGYLSSNKTGIVFYTIWIAIISGTLIIINQIAVSSFIIESNYIYTAISICAIHLIFSLTHQICFNHYYSDCTPPPMNRLSKKEKSNSLLLGLMPAIMFVVIIIPISLSIVNNVYFKGFNQDFYPNFPKENHLKIYSCDFDKMPKFSDSTNKIEIQEGTERYFYTNNYHYYKARIEALKNDLLCAKDFEEVAEIIKLGEQLDKNFKDLKYGYACINYSVTRNKYALSYKVNKLTYNASVGNDDEKKWGAKKNIINLAFKEKIELKTDSFEKGTDFSSIKVGVKIFYNDGSMKICYVTPSNAYDLNKASPGTHTFNWSDEWGEYSVPITIK